MCTAATCALSSSLLIKDRNLTPQETRAVKIVFLLAGGLAALGFAFMLLPEVLTLIFLAVAIPIMVFVRWRWGEAIDRWLVGG